ncbi:MAG: TonB family protein [Chthoniobacterales bacterium]
MKPFPWAYAGSILIHALVLLLGGFWLAHEAEYDVEAGETSMEVTLVEATPEPTPMPTPVPTPPPTPTPPTLPSEVPVEAIPSLTPTPTPRPTPVATATPRPVTKPASAPTKQRTSPAKPSAGSSGARGSTKPQYLSNPAPEYPASSRATGEHGEVMLRVEVDAKGRPASVGIFHSSGYQALDNAAVRAVKRWRFKPATVGGIPVATTINVPVQFQLH